MERMILLAVIFAAAVCEFNQEDAINHICSNIMTKENEYLAYHNGICYKFVNEQLSFSKANKKCGTDGGYLATVNSQSIQSFIENRLAAFDWEENKMYIGAKYDTGTDTWRWVGDANEHTGYIMDFTWTNWDDGEPGSSFFKEHYVVIRLDKNYKWHDVAEFLHSHSYICQYNRAQAKCPQSLGITEDLWWFNESCFWLVRLELTWQQAQSHCRNHGGNLVRIAHNHVQEFLVYSLRSFFHWSRNIWFGAKSIKEDRWSWISDNRGYCDEGLEWTNWASSYPTYGTNCAVMSEENDFKWKRWKCGTDCISSSNRCSKFPFVCQYDFSMSLNVSNCTTEGPSVDITLTHSKETNSHSNIIVVASCVAVSVLGLVLALSVALYFISKKRKRSAVSRDNVTGMSAGIDELHTAMPFTAVNQDVYYSSADNFDSQSTSTATQPASSRMSQTNYDVIPDVIDIPYEDVDVLREYDHLKRT